MCGKKQTKVLMDFTGQEGEGGVLTATVFGNIRVCTITNNKCMALSGEQKCVRERSGPR